MSRCFKTTLGILCAAGVIASGIAFLIISGKAAIDSERYSDLSRNF